MLSVVETKSNSCTSMCNGGSLPLTSILDHHFMRLCMSAGGKWPDKCTTCSAQAWPYQGILATSAVEAVIRCLQVVGRLPEGYSLGMPRCFVPSNPCSLIGRAKEEQQVLDGLQKNRCVIISGGPGEGKSALAQKVVWDMWERGELPGGAYPVNLAGADHSFLSNGRCAREIARSAWEAHTLIASMSCAGVSQSAMEDSSAAMPSEWMSQALANVLLRSISMDDVSTSRPMP